jgi:hypothetical protein
MRAEKCEDRDDPSGMSGEATPHDAVISSVRRTVTFRSENDVEIVNADDMVGGEQGSHIAKAQQNALRGEGENALMP